MTSLEIVSKPGRGSGRGGRAEGPNIYILLRASLGTFRYLRNFIEK